MPAFCPVCATDVPEYTHGYPDGAFVQCPVCSPYRVMERAEYTLYEMRGWTTGELHPFRRLSGALRQLAESGGDRPIVPVLTDPVALEQQYDLAADLPEMVDRILSHIRSKAPAGHKYVPLIGHRDYAIAGAEDPQAFDFALGKALEQGYIERQAPGEAAYRLTVSGWKHVRTLPITAKIVRRVFISHAAVDKRLAEFIAAELRRLRRDLDVFVASRSGDIRADQEWLRAIQDQLRAADAYCVLMTPNSAGRPWVWFETGAAWISGKKWVVARAAGFAANDVPLPVSINQSYALDDSDGARVIFRALDVDLPDAPTFAREIERLGADAVRAGLAAAGWEGIDHHDGYYAWAGPLAQLRDYEPQNAPKGLPEVLTQRGHNPAWERRDRVGSDGNRQVFLTDRRTYRRAIVYGADLVLVIRAPSQER